MKTQLRMAQLYHMETGAVELNSSSTTTRKQVQRDRHSVRIMYQQTDDQCFSITWLFRPEEREVSFKKLWMCRFQYVNLLRTCGQTSSLCVRAVTFMTLASSCSVSSYRASKLFRFFCLTICFSIPGLPVSSTICTKFFS